MISVSHRDTLCVLFTTGVMASLWNVMSPSMSAAGQKTNMISIHSSDSHAKSKQNWSIFWIIMNSIGKCIYIYIYIYIYISHNDGLNS